MTSASRSAESTRSVTSSRLPIGVGQTTSRPVMRASSRPPPMRRPVLTALAAAALAATVVAGTVAGAVAGTGGERPAQAQAAGPTAYAATLHVTRTIGPRPSASAGELRAHRYAAAQFRAAGLRVGYERFG